MNWNPKDFSQRLSDESDPISKEAFIEFATSTFGWTHTGYEEAGKLSKRDLVFMTQTGAEIWAETERKLEKHWNEQGRRNRYDTLHVPYRKKTSQSDVYAMFNHHLDTVAVGAMQKLKLAVTREVPCFVEDKWIDDLMYDCHQTGFRYYTKYQQLRWVEITMHGDIVTHDEPSSYRYQNQTPFLLGVEI